MNKEEEEEEEEEIVSRVRRSLASLAVMVLLAERVARKCPPDPTLLSPPDWPLLEGRLETGGGGGGETTGFQGTQLETKI